MRLALLTLCVLVSACSKPALEPVVLGDTRELEPVVLQLVQKKVAAVRAAPSDARTHGDLGLVYEANGLWDAAEQSFAQALALDDSRTIWLYHRALALHEGGHADAALAALREAAQGLPEDPAVQQRLGQWLLERGDAEGARTAFHKALAVRPDQSEFLTGLAGVELARGRWSEALLLAQRASERPVGRQPTLYVGQALLGMGRAEEARNFLALGQDAKVSWYPDELGREYSAYRLTNSALSEDAAVAAAQGNLSRAIELTEKLALRKPEDIEVLNRLGAGLIQGGRFERAGEVLAKALALAPESYSVHLNLCTLYSAQGKLAEARSAAERAVEVGGTLSSTHYQFARVLVLQNDLEGGYRELKLAIGFDDRDPRMFVSLAETAGRLSRLEEARGWCRKALEFDAYSLPARKLQCTLALSAGDLDEARVALAMLERIAPQDPRTATLREELQQAGR